MSSVKCPACKGTGEKVGTNPYFRYDICGWCQGTGTVTQVDADDWHDFQREAEKLRRKRR